MNRRLSAAALAIGLMLTFVWCDSAFAAERRVALIIGNSNYHSTPFLPNPARDADSIADKFKKAGYTVIVHNNVGYLDFKRAIREFEDKAADAEVAVIFYAGHGIEIRDENYLIPVDAKLARDRDARDEAVPLDRLLEAIEGAKRLRLIILDACRDNPFAGRMKRQRAATLRTISGGLALLEPTTNNSLIAYAAKAGTVAEDGNAQHSPYTTALLNHLFVPGLDIRLALGRVRDEVVKTTKNRQEPFLAGSLGGDSISIIPAPAEPPAVAVNAKGERDDYILVEKVGTKGAYEAFLASHPKGLFAELAREQLVKLTALDQQKAQLPGGSERSAVETQPAPPSGPTEDRRAWERIKDSSSATAFRDFIKRYPSSTLAITAKNRAEAIEQAAEEKLRAEREARAAEEARLTAEREEKARLAREAKAAEEARLKAEREAKAAEEARRKAEREEKLRAEREAKAAEETRLKAEREAAGKRAEMERLEKISEAERVKLERQIEFKRIEQERQTKLAEEARSRQAAAAEAARQKVEQAAAQAAQAKLDAACKREEARLSTLQSVGWRGRDDLKRLEQELTCDRLRPSVVAALERALGLPISNTPEQVRAAQQELIRLGCLEGNVDGDLGTMTRTALNRYLGQRGRKVSDVEITDTFVSELKSQMERVCPLVCPPGKVVEGAQCVVPAKPAPVARPKNEDQDDKRLKAKVEEPAPRKTKQEDQKPTRARARDEDERPARQRARQEEDRPSRQERVSRPEPRVKQEAAAPERSRPYSGGGGSRPMVGVGF